MSKPKKFVVQLTDDDVRYLKNFEKRRVHLKLSQTAVIYYWQWMKIILLQRRMINA